VADALPPSAATTLIWFVLQLAEGGLLHVNVVSCPQTHSRHCQLHGMFGGV